MVNFRDEIFKYQAINLNSLQEGTSSLSENEKNSIILYNKAITNLKMGSEDIAIIELKKAIAINSSFIDAMVLLGLCYMEIRDYAKALDTLSKVLAIDSGNVRAQEYCNIIKQKDPRLVMERKRSRESVDPSKGRTQNERSRQNSERPLKQMETGGINSTVSSPGSTGSTLNSAKSTESTYNTISRNRSDSITGGKTNSNSGNSLSSNKYSSGSSTYGSSSRINYNLRKYMTGLVAGILLASIVLIPAFLKEYGKNKEVKAFKTEQDSTEVKGGNVSAEVEAAVEKLNGQIKELNKQIESQNTELAYYRNASKLFGIRKLSQSGDYEAAADQLMALKGAAFKGTEKEEFDALSQDIFNKAAYKVSNEGTELFNQKKYTEAIAKLKKIEVYNPKFDYLNGALYVLGRCYQDSGDLKNAEATYRKVIGSFPNTENARYAQMRLNEMGVR